MRDVERWEVGNFVVGLAGWVHFFEGGCLFVD